MADLHLTEDEFEQLVVDELDALPDEMVDGLDNIVFVTEARPEDGTLDLLASTTASRSPSAASTGSASFPIGSSSTASRSSLSAKTSTS